MKFDYLVHIHDLVLFKSRYFVAYFKLADSKSELIAIARLTANTESNILNPYIIEICSTSPPNFNIDSFYVYKLGI